MRLPTLPPCGLVGITTVATATTRLRSPLRRAVALLLAGLVGLGGLAGCSAPAGGQGKPPAPSSPGSVANQTSVAFLGDSLTEGVGAPPGEGFAWQTAQRLGWRAVRVDGVSGSGYVAAGAGRPLPARVWGIIAAHPQVVVVSGGNNDAFQGYPPAAVRRGAEQTFRALAAGLPHARIVVLGPIPASVQALHAPDATNEAVRAAARAAGVRYIDARMLFRGAKLADVPDYISSDGLHPNEQGHAVIADTLAAALRTLTPAPAENARGATTTSPGAVG